MRKDTGGPNYSLSSISNFDINSSSRKDAKLIKNFEMIKTVNLNHTDRDSIKIHERSDTDYEYTERPTETQTKSLIATKLS